MLASGGADKSICIRYVYEKATIHVIEEAHDSKPLNCLYSKYFNFQATVLCVRFPPKGNFMCSASKDPTLKVWRISDFTLYAVIPEAHKGNLTYRFAADL